MPPRINARALKTLDAFGRASGQEWERVVERRGPVTLLIDQRPAEIFNAAGDLVGVDAVVRLMRRGREVPIDGHRIIINPPQRVSEEAGISREDSRAAFVQAVWESVERAPHPRRWRMPHGTVTTVYADTADGYITSLDTVYSTARSGGVSVSVNTGGNIQVGQANSSGAFVVYQGALSFDTSTLGTDSVTSAALDMYLSFDFSTASDFILEARAHTWLPTLAAADYVAGASLAGLTLYASLDSNGIGSTGAYKSFSVEAALAAACETGSVEMLLSSSRTRAGNAPGTNTTEYLIFSSADASGTTQDPKLTITHFPGPHIDDVTPSIVQDGQTGVLIEGTTFGASFDLALVELGSTNDHDTATLVVQSEISRADDEILITIVRGGLSLGTVYLFVTDDTGRVSNGFAITLAAPPEITSVTPSSFEDGKTGVVVAGQNFGASKGTGKIELIDGLDYDTASKELQTDTAWGATSVTMTIVRDDLPFSVYAVLTADNGLRSAPFPVRFGEPPAGTQQGWTQIVLKDQNGDEVGCIPNGAIESLEIHELINGAGYASWSSPMSATDVDLATMSRLVSIERQDEGEIFQGKILIREPREVDSTGAFEIDFVAGGLAEELAGYPSYASLAVLRKTAQEAADAAVAGTPWTAVVTGSGYKPVTKVWSFDNVMPVVEDLSKILNAYWRPRFGRILEYKNYHSASGLLLTNLQRATVDSQVGIIQSMSRIREDGAELANRIQPFGKTDTDAIFDLRFSTRTDPEIKSFTRPPVFIGQDRGYLGESSLIAGNTYKVENLNVEALGSTRAVVIFQGSPTTNAALRYFQANGKECVLVASDEVNGWTIAAYLLLNPAAGWQKFSAEVTEEIDHGFRAIAFDNVEQESPYAGLSALGSFRDFQIANGTGTTPSVTVDSDPNDMVIDFLILPSYPSGSILSGSGQQSFGNSITVFAGFSSYRVGASPTRTMTWTLGTSQPWILAAVSLKAYRNLYIEDEDSIAEHGLHYIPLPLGSFRVIDSSSYEEAANSMFDYAADELRRRKNAPRHYEIDLTYLPGHPQNWQPGDTHEVDYGSPALTVQESLICTERIQKFDEANVRHWSAIVSDQPVLLPSQLDILKRLQDRQSVVQSYQV
jgi:hypothetical protein